MMTVCLLASVEEDAPMRKSAMILCWVDETSRIVAIWRSQGFDNCRAKTRAKLRAFLEAVRITKHSIEYL
jgi:hypothetical protein